MKHWNLDGDPGYIPMAIDNIINRGTVKDWADMIAAAKADPQIRANIAALCKAVFDRYDKDEEANYRNYGFWQIWASGDESILAQVDFDCPEADTVWPYPDTVVIGPVEHPKKMRERVQRNKAAKPHIGSSLEAFLKKEGLYEDATNYATKRVQEWALQLLESVLTGGARPDQEIALRKLAQAFGDAETHGTVLGEWQKTLVVSYWQSRPPGERIEETWRLSEAAPQ